MFCLFLPASVVGQNYQLNVPVSDTIMKFNYSTIDACFPQEDISFEINPQLIPFATGLDVKVVITEIIPDSGVVGTDDGQLLNVGSEMFFSDTELSHPIYFFTASQIKYSYVVEGIPTVLNQPYYCAFDSAFSFASCGNWFIVYPEAGVPQCQVDLTMSTRNSESINTVHLFPNPAKENIQIRSNEAIKEIRIFNVLGQYQLHQKIDGNEIQLDVSSLPSGQYNATIIKSSGKQNIPFMKIH